MTYFLTYFLAQLHPGLPCIIEEIKKILAEAILYLNKTENRSTLVPKKKETHDKYSYRYSRIKKNERTDRDMNRKARFTVSEGRKKDDEPKYERKLDEKYYNEGLESLLKFLASFHAHADNNTNINCSYIPTFLQNQPDHLINFQTLKPLIHLHNQIWPVQCKLSKKILRLSFQKLSKKFCQILSSKVDFKNWDQKMLHDTKLFNYEKFDEKYLNYLIEKVPDEYFIEFCRFFVDCDEVVDHNDEIPKVVEKPKKKDIEIERPRKSKKRRRDDEDYDDEDDDMSNSDNDSIESYESDEPAEKPKEDPKIHIPQNQISAFKLSHFIIETCKITECTINAITITTQEMFKPSCINESKKKSLSTMSKSEILSVQKFDRKILGSLFLNNLYHNDFSENACMNFDKFLGMIDEYELESVLVEAILDNGPKRKCFSQEDLQLIERILTYLAHTCKNINNQNSDSQTWMTANIAIFLKQQPDKLIMFSLLKHLVNLNKQGKLSRILLKACFKTMSRVYCEKLKNKAGQVSRTSNPEAYIQKSSLSKAEYSIKLNFLRNEKKSKLGPVVTHQEIDRIFDTLDWPRRHGYSSYSRENIATKKALIIKYKEQLWRESKFFNFGSNFSQEHLDKFIDIVPDDNDQHIIDFCEIFTEGDNSEVSALKLFKFLSETVTDNSIETSMVKNILKPSCQNECQKKDLLTMSDQEILDVEKFDVDLLRSVILEKLSENFSFERFLKLKNLLPNTIGSADADDGSRPGNAKVGHDFLFSDRIIFIKIIAQILDGISHNHKSKIN